MIMNYIIAVFNSRSATLRFANTLQANHIPCAIINTPASLGRACGISVKFLSEFYDKARMFAGKSQVKFYSMNSTLNGTRINKN